MHTHYALANAAVPVAGEPRDNIDGLFDSTCKDATLQLVPLVDIDQDVRTKDTPRMGHICSYL